MFFKAIYLLGLLIPAHAMAAEPVVHSTFGSFLILLVLAIFVAWLLYRAIKKKNENI